MIRNKDKLTYCARHPKTDLYISHEELMDLMQNLTAAELRLYSWIKDSLHHNLPMSDYENKRLEELTGWNVKVIANLKSSLKKKGYLIFEKGMGPRQTPNLHIIMGKEQVWFYKRGVNVELLNSNLMGKIQKEFGTKIEQATGEEMQMIITEINNRYGRKSNGK